jgi:hypothetical protein
LVVSQVDVHEVKSATELEDPAALVAALQAKCFLVVNLPSPIGRLVGALEEVARARADVRAIVVVARTDLSQLSPFVDNDLIFFVASAPLPPAFLTALLEAGRRPDPARLGYATLELDWIRRVFLQSDSLGAARAAAKGLGEVIGAEAAHGFLLDHETRTLRCLFNPVESQWRESCATGVVGFVALTGIPQRVETLTEDVRYDTDVDDPLGIGAACLLAQPIWVRGTPRGVLALLRRGAPFSAEDSQRSERFVAEVAPAFEQLLAVEATEAERVDESTQTFRKEALLAHRSTAIDELTASSGTSRLARWAVAWIAAAVLGALALLTVRVPQTPRAEGRVVGDRIEISLQRGMPALSKGDPVEVHSEGVVLAGVVDQILAGDPPRATCRPKVGDRWPLFQRDPWVFLPSQAEPLGKVVFPKVWPR